MQQRAALRGSTAFCRSHGGGTRCEDEGCSKHVEGSSTPYCTAHGNDELSAASSVPEAVATAVLVREDPVTVNEESAPVVLAQCSAAHAGENTPSPASNMRKRCCKYEGGCSKFAQGGTPFCASHGGGKRCTFDGCTKSAVGKTPLCVAHGGGKRCASEGCTKCNYQ